MSHEIHDARGLALARRIAAGLGTHPEWITLARENLTRWATQNGSAPRLIACYEEWHSILAGPLEEISRALLDDSDEGQRRRQNSPFVGMLTQEEVREIKPNVHATTTP